MRFKLLLYIIVIFNVAGVTGFSFLMYRRFAVLQPQQPKPILFDLARECQGSMSEDGSGEVIIQSHVVVREHYASITNPCRLTLLDNAYLQVTNSELNTNNLIIESDEDTKTAKVTLDQVTLTGDDAGLYIGLKGSQAFVSVQDSLISFSKSVSLSTGSLDSDTGSRLSIQNSTIISEHSGSEGVVLASTGQVDIRYSVMKNPPDVPSLVVGNECNFEHNQGLTPLCLQ